MREISSPKVLSLTRTVLLEETAETSANVSIGDMNGDGHLDLLLVKGRHWPLHNLILLGDGTGALLPSRPLSANPDRSYSGLLVDIDRDNDLDIVVSNDAPDTNRVYLNNGTGSYSMGSAVGRAEWPTRHIKVVDMDNDGLPDVVFANRTGNRRPNALKETGHNFICFNKGAGQFVDDCLAFSGESATTVTPADFDGDGVLDLAVPHRDGGQSYIYLQGPLSSFGHRIPFGLADAAIRTAETADLDGDGILDLVVIDPSTGSFVLWGQPSITFEAPKRLGSEGIAPYAVALADVNEDGRTDVIVGHVNARPVVFFSGYGRTFAPVEFGDDQGKAYGFAVGDVDEDGFNDIAMARSGAPNVLYFGRPSSER